MTTRYYCGMCEESFTRSGECPKCGFDLERWPDENPRERGDDDGQTYADQRDALAERFWNE